jgi:hypothetical protein
MTPVARFLSMAALVGAAPTARAQVKTALPGWTMTTNVTVDSGGAGHTTSVAMRQQVTARNLRTEFVQVSGHSAPFNIEGMYFVVDIVDSTMISVMPAQHMATVMGLNVLGPIKTLRVSAEQNLTRNDLEDLGDGGRIRGHATHHYRMTTAGTMTMHIAGQTCTSTVDGVSEMWVAPDIDLGPMEAALANQMEALGGAAMELSGGVAPTKMPKGVALKSISKRTAKDATGKPITITTTTEVIEFAQTNLDPSLFSVPPDLQTMDMRKLMSEWMPSGALDSAMSSNVPEKTTLRLCSDG